MGVLDDRAAALEAEYTRNAATLARIGTAGQSQTMGGDASVSRIDFAALQKRQAQIIRSLQRLKYGGRMISINVTGASVGGTLPQVTQGV